MKFNPHSLIILTLFTVLSAASAAAGTCALGFTSMTEGPAGGTNSVLLAPTPVTRSWTNTANAAWLHLAATSGEGCANVVYSFDANPGETRVGTLTLAGETLTITQAGAAYVAANPFTALNGTSNAMSGAWCFAADTNRNIYIADNGTLKKWTAAADTFTVLASGLATHAVALDAAGNVYIADTGYNRIKRWNAADNTVSTLIPSGLNNPEGIAVDAAGNVYFTDSHTTLRRWNPADNTITNLATGLTDAEGLAMDLFGNIYIADNFTVKKWDVAANTLTTIVSGLQWVSNIGVDGSGNVYIAEYLANIIAMWNPRTGNLTNIVSGIVPAPYALAVDGDGNVYWSSANNCLLNVRPRAFVDPRPKSEPLAAGNDILTTVLPATQKLSGALYPTISEPLCLLVPFWPAITSTNGGVIRFSFTTNSAPVSRYANITVLGQSISITQDKTPWPANPPFALGFTNWLEGPAAGTDSVLLAASPTTLTWSNKANAAWLRLITGAGAGSTNVLFAFDANPGSTRTGTLTIAGLTLTITQAGAAYRAANACGLLTTNSYVRASYVTSDTSGGIYVQEDIDYTNSSLVTHRTLKWTSDKGFVSLIDWGQTQLVNPPVADNFGRLYFICLTAANTYNLMIWSEARVAVIPSASLGNWGAFTVDPSGIIDMQGQSPQSLLRWNIITNGLGTAFSLADNFFFNGIAHDITGAVYVCPGYADGSGAPVSYSIQKWKPGDIAPSTLAPPGNLLNGIFDLAVDGSGNVYFDNLDGNDLQNDGIRRWNVADSTITTVISPAALNTDASFSSLGVDEVGNVYTQLQTPSVSGLLEWTRAFVNTTPEVETAAAGSDSLSPVLPATEYLAGPFAPSSDQPWLQITGVTNGVVTFNFAANPGAQRVGHITLLGHTNAVIQAALANFATPPKLFGTKLLANGAFQFCFTNGTAGANFRVLSSTNAAWPLTNWTTVLVSTNTSLGTFLFTETGATGALRFYRVSSP